MKKHDHSEQIEKVLTVLPIDEQLCDLADFFKMFGDTTRIKILFSLMDGELCVCAIAELLSMSQSAISHQLKVLKESRIVANRRDGKTIYYSLSDKHVETILTMGFNHMRKQDCK